MIALKGKQRINKRRDVNNVHTPSLWEFIPHDDLAGRKKEFLARLSSPKGYRRYLGAPIRYPGGKSAAVGYIIERLPENVELVVSPFLGGGSVEVALANELGIKVIAFDIFDILVNFWQVLLKKDLKEKMLSTLRGLKPNRKTYEEVKAALKLHWRYTEYGEGSAENVIKDRAILAAYFFFNYQLSYGPGFLGWPSSVYLQEAAYENFLQKLEEFHAPNLEVHQADFREVIPKYKKNFLYLDPPYYIGEDSKMFRGIYPMRNFPIHHHGFPHDVLRDLLKEHEGGFILSYNDCPTIRSYYADDLQFFPRWHYSMGLGETRIGKYRKERGSTSHRKESHEILIVRYPKP